MNPPKSPKVDLVKQAFDNAETIPPLTDAEIRHFQGQLKKKNLPQLPQLPQAKKRNCKTEMLSESELEIFEERAAIMEFEGGLTREFAEFRALQIARKHH